MVLKAADREFAKVKTSLYNCWLILFKALTNSLSAPFLGGRGVICRLKFFVNLKRIHLNSFFLSVLLKNMEIWIILDGIFHLFRDLNLGFEENKSLLFMFFGETLRNSMLRQ